VATRHALCSTKFRASSPATKSSTGKTNCRTYNSGLFWNINSPNTQPWHNHGKEYKDKVEEEQQQILTSLPFNSVHELT
jgi:hypothetical protein